MAKKPILKQEQCLEAVLRACEKIINSDIPHPEMEKIKLQAAELRKKLGIDETDESDDY